MMAAENDLSTTSVSRSKAKKKSALSKLVERKKRQDSESDFGSKLSLQSEKEPCGKPPPVPIPLEPDVIIEKKTKPSSSCIPCKSKISPEYFEKPIPKPRSRKNSRASEIQIENNNSEKLNNNEDNFGKEVSKKLTDVIDLRNEKSDDGESPNGTVATDSTIFRFRNMRMAADQCDDGKIQGPFVPKPPTTPRTPRTPRSSVKGEKRNLEPSSGDEIEVDHKKHTPVLNGSDRIKEKAAKEKDKNTDKHISKVNSNCVKDNISIGSTISTLESKETGKLNVGQNSELGSSESNHRESRKIRDKHRTSNNSPRQSNQERLTHKPPEGNSSEHSRQRRLSKSKSVQQSPGKVSMEGSENEHLDPSETITQVHKHYQQLMDVDSASDSPLHIHSRRGSLTSHGLESMTSESRDVVVTPRSGRLAPLDVKHAPPPMDMDISSPGLRTAYKADSGIDLFFSQKQLTLAL